MSEQSFKEFRKTLNENSQMKNKLHEIRQNHSNKTMPAKETYDFICDKMIPFARKHGYIFDYSDYINYQLKEESKLLSDQDAFEVSGGINIFPKIMGFASTAALVALMGIGLPGSASAAPIAETYAKSKNSLSENSGVDQNDDNNDAKTISIKKEEVPLPVISEEKIQCAQEFLQTKKIGINDKKLFLISVDIGDKIAKKEISIKKSGDHYEQLYIFYKKFGVEYDTFKNLKKEIVAYVSAGMHANHLENFKSYGEKNFKYYKIAEHYLRKKNIQMGDEKAFFLSILMGIDFLEKNPWIANISQSETRYRKDYVSNGLNEKGISKHRIEKNKKQIRLGFIIGITLAKKELKSAKKHNLPPIISTPETIPEAPLVDYTVNNDNLPPIISTPETIPEAPLVNMGEIFEEYSKMIEEGIIPMEAINKIQESIYDNLIKQGVTPEKASEISLNKRLKFEVSLRGISMRGKNLTKEQKKKIFEEETTTHNQDKIDSKNAFEISSEINPQQSDILYNPNPQNFQKEEANELSPNKPQSPPPTNFLELIKNKAYSPLKKIEKKALILKKKDFKNKEEYLNYLDGIDNSELSDKQLIQKYLHQNATPLQTFEEFSKRYKDNPAAAALLYSNILKSEEAKKENKGEEENSDDKEGEEDDDW
ncbi:MAG: hypothetical protein LBI55_03055 [Oscillospiraceae bacterium]|jgi:hypothetical protein|nr:hypothetical protein [Oscillospiraceae bacterium]